VDITAKLSLDFSYNKTFFFKGEIDGKSGGNDMFEGYNIGIEYHMKKRNKELYDHDKRNKLRALDRIVLKRDKDCDGINDINDECPRTLSADFGTMKTVDVNDRGCQVDSDSDGVGDIKDIENTPDTVRAVHPDGKKIKNQFYTMKYFLYTGKIYKNKYIEKYDLEPYTRFIFSQIYPEDIEMDDEFTLKFYPEIIEKINLPEGYKKIRIEGRRKE
ncbi:MAG: hypothetical protein ABEH43_03500, partial [Flavobacteriales bacterium]